MAIKEKKNWLENLTDAAPMTVGTAALSPVTAGFLALNGIAAGPAMVAVAIGAVAVDLGYTAWKTSGVEFQDKNSSQKQAKKVKPRQHPFPRL